MANTGLLEEIVDAFEMFKKERENAPSSIKQYLFDHIDLPYQKEIIDDEELAFFEKDPFDPDDRIPTTMIAQLDVYDARMKNKKFEVYAIPLNSSCKPLEDYKGWYELNDIQIERLCEDIYDLIEQNREMIEKK